MAKRGPRTEAGKRRSALNAVSHGALSRSPVIPGFEAEADWTRHLAGFHESLAPANPFEAFLVDSIAQTAWRLQRIELYETQMLSLAQAGAEEQAAARILFPNGGAISLRGATAASLIQDRIDALRRLADILIALQSGETKTAQLSRDDLRLLYEGLNLALSHALGESTGLQRQLLQDLIAGPPEEEDKARALAANVRRILREMDEIVGDPAHPEALEGRPPSPEAIERSASTILTNYPFELVLIPLWPEIQRLEHEQLDLDATIARIRRESLILDTAELARITRYEAHLRRQLIQYLHELEARQSQRGGRPTPLARLDVQLLAN